MLPIFHQVGESKISNFAVEISIKQDILWFEIPVCNQVQMCPFEALENLLEKISSCILGEIILLQVLIELAIFGQLHNNKDLLGCVKYLVKFDDVRVGDESEDSNFPFDL